MSELLEQVSSQRLPQNVLSIWIVHWQCTDATCELPQNFEPHRPLNFNLILSLDFRTELNNISKEELQARLKKLEQQANSKEEDDDKIIKVR